MTTLPCRRPKASLDRGRAVMARSTAAGMGATDAALAAITTAFDNTSIINSFKLKVEYFLRLGPHSEAVWARYGARLTLLRDRSIDDALFAVGCWLRAERPSNRLAIGVLRELQLMLRLARRSFSNDQYHSIVNAVLGGDVQQVA